MKNVNSLSPESRDWAENLTQNISKQAKLIDFWEKAYQDGFKRSEIGCWLRWGHTKRGLKAKLRHLTKLYLTEFNNLI